MNAEILLQHFERISEAPDAIPHLRRFILDLAVRGKLVEQDPSDEPASEWLKRIAVEKAQLVKVGEIRQDKPLPPIQEDALPFELPSGWAWERLGNIGVTNIGLTYSPQDISEQGTPVLRSSNIQNGKLDFSDLVRVKDEPKQSVMVQQDDLLICARNGSRALVGKVAVIEGLKEPAAFGAFMAIFRSEANRYLYHFICSALFRQVIAEVNTTTINQITQNNLRSTLAPIPPLAEQHRIVAKVDELMTLCDQLEAAKAEREQGRDRLVAASLQRLNKPADDEEAFREHARFTFNHLPRLTTRPAHIKQLRQTILNLAVRGKLVSQDAKEGTGKDLLSSIKKARAEWETTGRIRKERGGQDIAEDEKYFEVPETWVWAQLTEIGQTQTGTSPSSANTELFGDFIPFVKPADLDGNEINYDGPGLSEAGVRHSRLVSADSVLMVCIGATLGKVNKTTRGVCFNQQINSLTPYLDGLTNYLALALKTSRFQALAWSKAGTGTLPIISKGKWEILPIPLPPLAEQHRIVAKVDELMSLCDQLEGQLNTTEIDSRRLLEAVLHEALAPALEEAA